MGKSYQVNTGNLNFCMVSVDVNVESARRKCQDLYVVRSTTYRGMSWHFRSVAVNGRLGKTLTWTDECSTFGNTTDEPFLLQAYLLCGLGDPYLSLFRLPSCSLSLDSRPPCNIQSLQPNPSFAWSALRYLFWINTRVARRPCCTYRSLCKALCPCNRSQVTHSRSFTVPIHSTHPFPRSFAPINCSCVVTNNYSS